MIFPQIIKICYDESMSLESDKANLEKYVWTMFGLQVEVKTIIANKVPAGASSMATVFLSNRGVLYAFVATRGGQTLGDVKKILSRMNLKPDQFLPPHADKNYFLESARDKFIKVFPGRQNINEKDLGFYRTLVSYNPALVQIAEVENGVIKQYDTDAVGHWRTNVKFTYRRITTS